MQKFILPKNSAIMTDIGYVNLTDLKPFDRIQLLNGDLRKPQVIKNIKLKNIKGCHLKSRKSNPLLLAENQKVFSNHTKYYTNTQYFDIHELETSDTLEFIRSNFEFNYNHNHLPLFWKIVGMCILRSDLNLDESYNSVLELSVLPKHLDDFELKDTLIELGFIIDLETLTAKINNQTIVEELMYLKELPELVFNLPKINQRMILDGVASYVSKKDNGTFSSRRIYIKSWAKTMGIQRLALNSDLNYYINNHKTKNSNSNGYILTLKYEDLVDPFTNRRENTTITPYKDLITKTEQIDNDMIQFILNSDSPIIIDNYLIKSEIK